VSGGSKKGNGKKRLEGSSENRIRKYKIKGITIIG